ncbi:twin-arginine translocase TatA/TatE family subunit [Brevundimonas subvibrioides]|uniref:twin-arginine translocase TatA/TatE family subunit n=1 Tax=Brevundimonas subvibrioides TaxID=74313 RepID=UPI0022B5B818|nr:twin-arginine translocase TatA/TatE family subunit [Brevundimonas subvibrioides]
MGAWGPTHWIFVAVVVLILFGGKGKLSGLMGDAAKGIKAFRDGMREDDKKDGPHEGVSSLPRTDAEKEELKR